MRKHLALVGLVIVGLAATGCTRRETALKLTIEYPEASPQVIEETIAVPVEQQVSGVEGLSAMTSICGGGHCDVYIRSRPTVDPARFANLVANRIQLAAPILPHAVRVGEVVDISDRPIPPLPEVRDTEEQYVNIDASKARELGISVRTAWDTVREARGAGGPLAEVTIESADGEKIRLCDFAQVKTVRGPNYRVRRFPPPDK